MESLFQSLSNRAEDIKIRSPKSRIILQNFPLILYQIYETSSVLSAHNDPARVTRAHTARSRIRTKHAAGCGVVCVCMCVCGGGGGGESRAFTPGGVLNVPFRSSSPIYFHF